MSEFDIWNDTSRVVECIRVGKDYKNSELLKIGERYTVKDVKVHSWHTDVFLVGFGEIEFNSCSFAECEKAGVENDD